ncbi:hypothetical protein [Streptomyces sp. CAU 1734]|uniref:hypothetical protein n=1 Tax=Streptomyces sp. CAU 1734 TaxID=3140360 RepID=UPI0032611C78
MTILRTVLCDRAWRYGSCGARHVTAAPTDAEALAEAAARGWAVGTGPGALCPVHSGRTPTRPAPVRPSERAHRD